MVFVPLKLVPKDCDNFSSFDQSSIDSLGIKFWPKSLHICGFMKFLTTTHKPPKKFKNRLLGQIMTVSHNSRCHFATVIPVGDYVLDFPIPLDKKNLPHVVSLCGFAVATPSLSTRFLRERHLISKNFS